jgi:hypothetical protein
MAHGSCQKQVYLVPEKIFSLVAKYYSSMYGTTKGYQIIENIRIIFIIKCPQNDAPANPPILVPNTP